MSHATLPRCKGKFGKIKKCTQEGGKYKTSSTISQEVLGQLSNNFTFITFGTKNTNTRSPVKKSVGCISPASKPTHENRDNFHHYKRPTITSTSPIDLFSSTTSTCSTPKKHERRKDTHMLELTFHESSNTYHITDSMTLQCVT